MAAPEADADGDTGAADGEGDEASKEAAGCEVDEAQDADGASVAAASEAGEGGKEAADSEVDEEAKDAEGDSEAADGEEEHTFHDDDFRHEIDPPCRWEAKKAADSEVDECSMAGQISYEEYVRQRVLILPFEEVIAKNPRFAKGLLKNPAKAEQIRSAWGGIHTPSVNEKLKALVEDCAKKGMFNPTELTQEDIGQLVANMKKKGVMFDKGLSDSEVSAIENKYFEGKQLPPDLRAFWQFALPISDSRDPTRLFPNWRNPKVVSEYMDKSAHSNIPDEIMFDIEHNDVWCPGWGEKPVSPKLATMEHRFDPHLGRAVTVNEMMSEYCKRRVTHGEYSKLYNYWKTLQVQKVKTIAEGQTHVRELIRHAPKLVPICDRRFMAAEPHTCGQPVLSIFRGTDIIFYGNDLAHFLAEEFKFQPIRPPPPERQVVIPFWDKVVEINLHEIEGSWRVGLY